jgi:hypothetical protein
MRLLVLVLYLALLFACPSASSHIHSARDGSTVSWYPHDCCHDGDCRPVARVWHAPNGLWMETVDGQTVLSGQKMTTALKDMRWHICIAPDDTDLRNSLHLRATQ